MARQRSVFHRFFRILRYKLRKRGRDPLFNWRLRVATGMGAVLLGLIALAFAFLGDLAQSAFLEMVAAYPLAPLIVTPAIFGALAYITTRFVREAAGSGIPQVIAAGRDPGLRQSRTLVSLRTAIAKVVMTLAMLCGGASVGREGPTVQISAAIMVAMHRLWRVRLSAGVIIAGGAAGVAAAFNTPLAGIAFAIEELAAAYEQRVAVLVMGAVMISGLVSLGIAGDYIYFGAVTGHLDLAGVLLIAPFAGILGGLSGGLFSRLLLGFADARHAWARILRSRPVLFATACGIIVAVTGILTGGDTWGTGYEPTRELIEYGDRSIWFGPAKFLATLATAISGVPGGIFAPSLSVGAGFGNLLKPLFPNQQGSAIILLGMVAYFVGVVRAPLTAVIILIEATASRAMILPMFATALIADMASATICRERLYHGLARRYFVRTDGDEDVKEKPVAAG